MTDGGLPTTIALASDLSHRSDRALDRAIQLASAWQARLLVVHAVEARAESFLDDRDAMAPRRRVIDPVQAAKDCLRRDLANQLPQWEIDIAVRPGSPAPMVLEEVKRTGAQLIVTGVARDELLGRMLLGDTVDRLLRKSPVPLLIVRQRAYAPYRSMVVATDFSSSSRVALEVAARLFPQVDLTLFNACDIPFADYLQYAAFTEQFDSYGRQAADKLMQEAGIPTERARLASRMIEQGAPAPLLRDLSLGAPDQLTVVGTHGGGKVYETLIGSTARRILDAVPGDVLVVPDPARR